MGQSEAVRMGIIATRSAIAQEVVRRWESKGMEVIELTGDEEIPEDVAALVIDPGSPIDASSMDMERFRRVLDRAKGANLARVVIISSSLTMARDDGADRVFEESWRPVPGSEERGSAVERAVWREGEIYRSIAQGLDAVMINPTLVVGEEEWGEELEMIAQGLEGACLPGLLEGGEVAMVRQADVARALIAAMERGRRGRRYLVSGGEMEVGRVLEALIRARGGKLPRRRWDTKRFVEVVRWIPDHAIVGQAMRLLGLEGQRQLVDMRGKGRGERCAGELMIEPLEVGAPEMW